MLVLVLLGVDLDNFSVGMGVLGVGAAAVGQMVAGNPDIETDVLGVVEHMIAAAATMVFEIQEAVQPAEARLHVVHS